MTMFPNKVTTRSFDIDYKGVRLTGSAYKNEKGIVVAFDYNKETKYMIVENVTDLTLEELKNKIFRKYPEIWL